MAGTKKAKGAEKQLTAAGGQPGGAASATLGLSDTTLEDIPRRALALLLGISRSAVVRTILGESGYDAADHARGWKLLQAVGGQGAAATAPIESKEVGEAVKTLDEWDEKGFRLVTLTWQRRYPDLLAFVLRGDLHAEVGKAAVMSSATLLGRLDAIPTSEERKDSRAQDAEALALLAKRGLDPAERRRLGQLVEVAQSDQDAHLGQPAISATDRRAALEQLYFWWEEWSEIARLKLTRRDHLILLGLAKRKTKAKTDGPPPTP